MDSKGGNGKTFSYKTADDTEQLNSKTIYQHVCSRSNERQPDISY